MKILNFGSCNVDYVYSVDHIVGAGETEKTDKLCLFPGGKGLNQSIALSKAGLEVYHAGCIGDGGEFLLQILKDNGVDTSFIKCVNEKNGHAIIQVSSEGENSIFLYPGSNEMITKEHINHVLNNFSKGDIILLQNEINSIEYIIQQANRIGMQIVLNPSPYNDNISQIDLRMISYLILNEVEARDISGYDEPESILQYFKNEYPKLKVMLTLGKKGCIYQDETERIYHPIFKVDVVDTTAAGDTFTGYFVAGIAAETEYKEVLRIASCASALAVSKNGAAPSIPEMSEVLKYIKLLHVNNIDYKSEKIKNIVYEYITNHIENASLDDLADILGYSAVYTGNLIKKITGKTFKKVLQEKRISLSAELLLETEMSISEIIKKVGYENESFFREIFKNNYGVTPFAYRKMEVK